MPDDDNLQEQSFQSTDTAADIAGAVAAALAAIASGAVLRANEILALADQVGDFEIDVSSSAIAKLGYNVFNNTCSVEFNDGTNYYYPNVPMWQFLRWLNASSKGGFFNEEVRGKWGPWPIGSSKRRRAL